MRHTKDSHQTEQTGPLQCVSAVLCALAIIARTYRQFKYLHVVTHAAQTSAQFCGHAVRLNFSTTRSERVPRGSKPVRPESAGGSATTSELARRGQVLGGGSMPAVAIIITSVGRAVRAHR